MPAPEDILSKYWGYSSFRPLQKEIIESILAGKDTLALLPTGGGKSVCYQVPALMNKGLCLVVSPLIALMQDQVNRLNQLEIDAACIHSGMHYKDVGRVFDGAVNGEYKLLYVSPERLQTRLFNDYLADLHVTLLAVDEAHCVSQWGHDFRPAYLKIASVREEIPDVPILALTATATPDVQEDIARQLQLRRPKRFRQSFSRDNIFYEVHYSENKPGELVLNAGGACSIVYCRSRKQTEAATKYLKDNGIAAATYHAGMAKDKRDEAQAMWMAGEAAVMVATTAFGMGIDKADVRTVLHYDAPEHPEAYYQEAGRAGRDGKPSLAYALYNYADIKRLQESTALQYPPEAYLRQVYQSVVEYLQIPIGTVPDQYFSFDLADFCRKFGLQATAAIHALRLLEREGLWTMTEPVYNPATIQFIADRHTLDGLANVHPGLHYVTVGLLRMYNTIFHYPTAVRESAIARQLRMQREELDAALLRLHEMELLEYRKPAEGPQLYFHHYRVDSRHLIIDLNRINILRQRHIARTEAMISFLENRTMCRERLLLTYFGENVEQDCGHCDVCRDKQPQKVDMRQVRKAIMKMVKQEGSVSVEKLMDPYPTAIEEAILALVREMIDEGVVSLRSNGDICPGKQ